MKAKLFDYIEKDNFVFNLSGVTKLLCFLILTFTVMYSYDVRVILPLYGAISEEYVNQMRHELDFEVDLGWRKQYCGIEALNYNGVTFYFVDNKYYFGRSYIYGMGGDEGERQPEGASGQEGGAEGAKTENR